MFVSSFFVVFVFFVVFCCFCFVFFFFLTLIFVLFGFSTSHVTASQFDQIRGKRLIATPTGMKKKTQKKKRITGQKRRKNIRKTKHR